MRSVTLPSAQRYGWWNQFSRGKIVPVISQRRETSPAHRAVWMETEQHRKKNRFWFWGSCPFKFVTLCDLDSYRDEGPDVSIGVKYELKNRTCDLERLDGLSQC